LHCAFYFRLWEMIPAHGVEGYGHHVVSRVLSFDYFNHFAAFINAAVRARAVRADLHVAIRTFSQVWNFQRIVRPAG
jgi:hypothetical protein